MDQPRACEKVWQDDLAFAIRPIDLTASVVDLPPPADPVPARVLAKPQYGATTLGQLLADSETMDHRLALSHDLSRRSRARASETFAVVADIRKSVEDSLAMVRASHMLLQASDQALGRLHSTDPT